MGASTKTPQERLDAFSKWVFGEGGAQARLATLEAAMVVTLDETADSIALQLSDLVTAHDGQAEALRQALLSKATNGVAVKELREQMDELEAQPMLDVAMAVTDKGKALYSNPQTRAAALLVEMGKNERWVSVLKQWQIARMDESVARANVASIEAEEKTWKARVSGLIAQLENLTARFAGNHKTNGGNK